VPASSPSVFDHVGIRVADRAASERFYSLVLSTLGIELTHTGDIGPEWDDFALGQATPEQPATRRLHVAFVAPSRAAVDSFWRAGTAAGFRDDGAPGPRPQYRDDYYGSFLLDPDGNTAEAVHHGAMRQGGNIDHIWIRVADRPASRRFYEAVAPHAGFRLNHDLEDRTQFVGETGSFSIVDGEPSENVHVAFPVAENEAVDAFHAAVTGVGFRDNGKPGERRRYHDGYYAAFVLDPDGNNIELVNHNR
jgi:catechol 2,3-dioxygenase-like lactoylglutathione lyase family enzyme